MATFRICKKGAFLDQFVKADEVIVNESGCLIFKKDNKISYGLSPTTEWLYVEKMEDREEQNKE